MVRTHCFALAFTFALGCSSGSQPDGLGGAGPASELEDSGSPSGSGDGSSTGGSDNGGSDNGGTSQPPTALNLEGASGERGSCSIPADGAEKVADLECETRTLKGTGHEYCVKAHPDCKQAGTGCFVIMTFNMGNPYGLSYTYQSRVSKPGQYGKFVVVGGGTSADNDVMAELPRAVMEEFPGIDERRIYVLGNSKGAGAVQAIAESNSSQYGTTYDLYAAGAIFGGRFKNTEQFDPTGKFHLLLVNGWDDVGEPDGVRELAAINDCSDPQAAWRNVASGDAYVPGDGTDKAQKLTFGDCPGGDVLAYRFRDEGHVTDFSKNFDPKVRALHIAWDFFTGRTNDESGISGSGSSCYAAD